MSDTQPAAAIDMIRWTFTINPEKCAEIETYLTDLGAEVLIRPECQLVALWDETEHDLDVVVEELWEIHGGPVDVTHEEFHRAELLIYHADDSGEAQAA
jgi:hypothetical protein